jgi:hypothetical protein
MPGFIRVDHEWSGDEWRSAFLCRLGRFGTHSRVPPGLYALGSPDSSSAVLVTSNYRLSFDLLRRDNEGLDCWILALDTKGLGVGSAAAAGLFSTDELVIRINASRLARVVSHRALTLPPRAASVVDAALIARATGFEARIGPSRTADTVPGVLDTLVLTPVELGRSLMLYPGFAFAVLLYAGLGPGGVTLGRAFAGSWQLLLLGLAGVVCGSLIGPVLPALFPRLPLWMGGGAAGLAATAALLKAARLESGMGTFLVAACWMFFPAAAAFLSARFSLAMPDAVIRPAAEKSRVLFVMASVIALLTLAALVLAKAAQWGTLAG